MRRGLVCLLVSGILGSCAGDGTGLDENGIPLSATLVLSPGDVALIPTGTVRLSAVDGNGVAIAGANLQWSSSRPAVAQVDANGVVTAVAAGVATVSATRDPATGTAEVVVVASAAFAADVQSIFTASCAFAGGCHAGPNPQQGQDLSSGNAFSNIVSVASMQVPSLFRINPGDPLTSYLVHKIQNTQASVGGTGVRMPFGGTLTQGEIDVIRAWVQSGAPNN